MIPRDVFCRRVRSFVGTPFRHRGRLPGVALDCAGVVVCALATYGVEAPDIRYGETPSESEVYAGLSEIAERVPLEDRQPGDVVTMQVGGREVHMAVLVGRNASGRELFVQPTTRRQVVEAPMPRGAHLRSCWRLREVESWQ